MVDQATRNVQVQATLQNGEQKLRPGMFAKVSVILPQREQVIALPVSSVHYAPYGDSVFVVGDDKDEDGKPIKSVKEQFVKLGTARANLFPVVSVVKPVNTSVTSTVSLLTT